jgi:hypothetical protein
VNTQRFIQRNENLSMPSRWCSCGYHVCFASRSAHIYGIPACISRIRVSSYGIIGRSGGRGMPLSASRRISRDRDEFATRRDGATRLLIRISFLFFSLPNIWIIRDETNRLEGGLSMG